MELNNKQIVDTNKYLTFQLNKEIYGLEILKVREIIGMMEVTAVPKTPDFIKGVINLRGTVIPIVDLRLKFDMEETEYDEQTCIIVVSVKIEDEDVLIGIIVDTVSEVMDIPTESIEPKPEFGGEVDTEYILGMGKMDEKVIILLDIDKVLNIKELAALA
jgi:purine-binding chemotaxis protein CheW